MKYFILLILWLSIVAGQSYSRSEYEIIEEWKDYTDFQRTEQLSFCEFLFDNKYYDRAQLNLFRYLYKYPNETFEPVLYYYIARSYEELEKYDLALEYYSRITNRDDTTSVTYKSAIYRTIYIHLMNRDNEIVLLNTEDTDDPYFLIFRAYAMLNEQRWDEASRSLKKANKRFNHRYYSKLIAPVIKSINAAQALPKKNKSLALGMSIIPGVGQSYLKQWKEVIGILTTSTLLYVFASEEKQTTGVFTYQPSGTIPYSTSIITTEQGLKASRSGRVPMTLNITNHYKRYIISPIVLGVGVYIGSVVKTKHDIDLINKQSEIDYINNQIQRYSVSRFLDFDEPELR